VREQNPSRRQRDLVRADGKGDKRQLRQHLPTERNGLLAVRSLYSYSPLATHAAVEEEVKSDEGICFCDSSASLSRTQRAFSRDLAASGLGRCLA
jgi:hypothetical protein